MRRLWARLFGVKEFGCGQCGKWFRTDIELGKHVWHHEGF